MNSWDVRLSTHPSFTHFYTQSLQLAGTGKSGFEEGEWKVNLTNAVVLLRLPRQSPGLSPGKHSRIPRMRSVDAKGA